MTILKRGCLAVLALVFCVMLLPGLVCEVSAQSNAAAENNTISEENNYPEYVRYSADELIARIGATYQGAKDVTGFWGFYGRCSTLVNGSLVALGITSEYNSCDGKEEYNLYEDMSRTDCGYDVVCYSAEEYSLAEALYAVSDNGTRDVFNIVVGWQGGRTGASSAYGHTCFIQGIVDGVVYFCESFGLEIEGEFYAEGEPIVVTIEEFANYYNKWAYFEGIVHFDYPDFEAPQLAEMETRFVSQHGFTLNFDASDNIGIEQIYAKVWHYGQTEDDAVTIPVPVVEGKAWVRVDTADFENFHGRYYVNCYAVDRKGNVSVIGMAEEGMSLYQPDQAAGVYQVKDATAGVHNAPYDRVNDTETRESEVSQGMELSVVGSLVNDDGELWYLLSDGGWVNSASLRQVYSWADIWAYVQEFLAGVLNG